MQHSDQTTGGKRRLQKSQRANQVTGNARMRPHRKTYIIVLNHRQECSSVLLKLNEMVLMNVYYFQWTISLGTSSAISSK